MKADIASFNAATQNGIPYTGVPAARLLYVVTYETPWKSAASPGDVYYLAFQFNSDGSKQAFGGKLDGNNATTGSVNAVTYNPKSTNGVPVVAKLTKNGITLKAKSAKLGVRAGERIYSFTAFSFAGPAQSQEISASALSRMIDATPAFDAILKDKS